MSCTDVQTIQAGNGTKTQFSFDFPYIFKSEIHVYFWNATTKEWDEKLTTDATHPWRITDANPTIVEFTSTAPPSPTTPVDPNESTIDNVKIRRITNLDDIRALFNPGSAIRSDDLNNNFEQLRYAIQESNCPGVTDEVYEYLLENYWDRFDNTLYSADTWRSDDATIATTAALDARFQDEVAETITSTESWPSNDDTVGTTLAVENRVTAKIDDAITNDIAADSSGITVTDDGDGTITLSIENGDLALTKIDPNAIITSAETWANNDDTIATTAKIDDVIDDAITGDILIDSTGLTKSTSGGQTTLGIGSGSVDIDRIKAENIITEAEQDSGTTETDDNLFTALAAAKRFDTLVQTANPGLAGNWEVGKTWLQNDADLTLSIWNGTAWTAITSGGTFTNQPSVVYVDQASGDDNNDGHRISRPKATIRAAINQINAEINTSITNGGSGYVEGTYNTVSLTGGNGTGTGLTANITVNASGVVSAVTVNSTTTLEDYSIGDVLSANNADLGGSGSGLAITVGGDGDGQIVIVSAGTYQEAAPIQIKRRNVSIIGQALRSCIVHPTVATQGDQSDGNHALFELNSGSYIANLTLTGMQANNAGVNALDAVLPSRQGWNFAFYEDAFIVKSPYIQNCTNFSDSEIDNSDLRAHRPRGGAAGDTDSAPTGGGMLVNGATPHDNSPLRSMVADSYTHVGLNGPGVLVVNNGYAQITSSYAFFNRYHIKCLSGGQANLAASTTDFGDQALVADGRSTNAIFTSTTFAAAADQATEFFINGPTARTATPLPWHGTEVRPQSNMLVDIGGNTYPILSASNTFDADEIVSGRDYTILTVGDTDFTAIGAASNTVGVQFTATGVGTGSGTVTDDTGWRVTISRPNPNNRGQNLGLNGAVASSSAVSFFLRSQVASSGHTMEYVGSGTNYNALPENGGVPVEANQIIELNNGKVWTAVTDHNGKFKIGGNQTSDPIFEVDQQLGFVTIPTGSIAFDLVSDLTPQLGGNLDVNGNTITGLANPSANNEAANKAYVDSVAGTPTRIAQLNTNVEATDTGTDGTIAFTTDGTRAMTIDNSQRVGIGTSSPGSAIHVKSGAVTTQSTVSDFISNATARFVANHANEYGAYIGYANGATDGIAIQSVTNAGSTKPLLLNPYGANVGVGTTTVNRQLVLHDNTLACLALQNSTTGNTTSDGFQLQLSGTDAYVWNYENSTLIFGTNNTERARIDSSGRLLVGTTSASNSSKLQVQGSNSGAWAVQLRMRDNANDYCYVGFSDKTGGESIANIWSQRTGANTGIIAFETNNGGSATERMRIDSSGRVGIGTGSPSEALTVSGKIQATTEFKSGTGNDLRLNAGSANRDIFMQVNGSTLMTVQGSTGRVGIGTTSPGQLLSLKSTGGETQLSLTSDTNQSTGIYLGDTDSVARGFIQYDNSVDALRIASAGSERARITSNGDFYIGSPSNLGTNTKFLVRGGAQGAANGYLAMFSSNTGTNSYEAGGGFYASGSSSGASRSVYMYLDADGANFSGNDSFYAYKAGGGGIAYLMNQSSAGLVFGTAATERCFVDSAGHFKPWSNNTYDLGSSSQRWRNIYTNDLNLSNEGSTNDVDGTWGSWTIQEGEDDLFLLNRRNGKKYKFNLTEVN